MSGTISSAGISAARDNHIETVFSYLFFSIRKPGLLPGFFSESKNPHAHFGAPRFMKAFAAHGDFFASAAVAPQGATAGI